MSTTINESATLVLEGRNGFFENSVTSSLLSISDLIPAIRNCTTIENNTANITFTFSKYIELHKSARVEIIGNKYNPNQKLFNRFIFEKTRKSHTTECPFHVNQAIIYYGENKGYYRNFYGKYLDYNYSWSKGYQGKNESLATV